MPTYVCSAAFDPCVDGNDPSSRKLAMLSVSLASSSALSSLDSPLINGLLLGLPPGKERQIYRQ